MNGMRRRTGRAAALAAALLGVLVLLGVALAQPKPKRVDIVWQRPDLDSLGIRSIAFLPAISYDHSLEKEQEAEEGMAQTIRGLPYRWVAPLSVQALLKVRPAADSVWKRQRESVLKSPSARIDSLAAPVLCGAFRVQALLTLRVDRMEQVVPEFNQAGKPTTTLTAHAALVDTTGRLLWTISGTETGEGQYYDPNAGVVGVQGSGLGTKPLTGQMGAPTYREVGARLFERWAELFPRPRTATAPAR